MQLITQRGGQISFPIFSSNIGFTFTSLTTIFHGCRVLFSLNLATQVSCHAILNEYPCICQPHLGCSDSNAMCLRSLSKNSRAFLMPFSTSHPLSSSSAFAVLVAISRRWVKYRASTPAVIARRTYWSTRATEIVATATTQHPSANTIVRLRVNMRHQLADDTFVYDAIARQLAKPIFWLFRHPS